LSNFERTGKNIFKVYFLNNKGMKSHKNIEKRPKIAKNHQKGQNQQKWHRVVLGYVMR